MNTPWSAPERAEEIWKKVRDGLREQLTTATMASFFDDARAVDLTADTLVIEARGAVSRDVIATTHIEKVKAQLFDLFSAPFECKVLAGASETAEYLAAKEKPMAEQFCSLPQLTFDTFVVGNSNRFAHAAALSVAEETARSYNPLFIYGGSGLGKTHLLYAIANALRGRHRELRVVYTRGEDFLNELIELLREGRIRDMGMKEFREKYRTADLLLVDDIQFIAGKEATQEEFFNTFNSLHEAGKQIILTSDRPPKDMARLDERLRTRFEWGLLADIQPPDIETRVAIIRNKAAALHLELSDGVVDFIAENITANVRQIEGVVKKMQAYCTLLREPINIETASKAIGDIFVESPGLNPTAEIIIEETERFFDLEAGALASKKRDNQTARARQVATYLIRTMTKLSFPDIGRALARHHSTIMYSVDQIAEERKRDPKLDSDLRDLGFNIQNR